MAKKKKTSGLSIAIVALNIVIVGIIILLIVLVYMHMKDDSGSGRGETTTAPVTLPTGEASDSGTAAPDGSGTNTAVGTEENGSQTDNTDAPDETVFDPTAIMVYTQEFFADDLFIGDSISTGLYLYDYLEKDNVFAEVGLNPESALTKQIDGVTCIDKANDMNPKRIYIMLGSNGLAFMDGQYMASKLVELIAELEMACPTAKICVISIPPVSKAHDSEGNETMEKVNTYNAALKSICDEGGYAFVDICTLFKDSEGFFADKYVEADGLHFQGNTYSVMLGYIQKVISENE
ncbi:MAG: GDSL-type esterase/lipase family protein [Firmicutes bacterium]|nr:GDSL-type esterase/lipase family protein [[Eubacterium] siraeum]MCM1488950.1 GDSL-type esterase/lipase family protein [Bacillota bacterium]